MNREPVITANSITGVVLAVLALIGVSATDAQVSAIGTIAAVVVPLIAPLIAGYIARKRVTPTSNVADPVNRGTPPGRR